METGKKWDLYLLHGTKMDALEGKYSSQKKIKISGDMTITLYAQDCFVNHSQISASTSYARLTDNKLTECFSRLQVDIIKNTKNIDCSAFLLELDEYDPFFHEYAAILVNHYMPGKIKKGLTMFITDLEVEYKCRNKGLATKIIDQLIAHYNPSFVVIYADYNLESGVDMNIVQTGLKYIEKIVKKHEDTVDIIVEKDF